MCFRCPRRLHRGVLVQTNFGGVLKVDGVPVGKALHTYYLSDKLNYSPDGSCMIAFSTNEKVRVPYESDHPVREVPDLSNDAMSPLFMAAIEATEEAILNALFQAETMTGRDHHEADALPVDKVLRIMEQHDYRVSH